jgi:3-deoxy-manno-octulosonate cytidylyltransferase (CMP-KDO synthetase)
MPRTVAIIPARMGSSRFPGKPLAPLLGKPMIEHVYRRTAMCDSLAETLVATCDDEIRDVVEAFGGRAVMTSDRHERASDRIAEAALAVDADIAVLVQGDEPLTHPRMIDQALGPFAHEDGIECVNLTRRIDNEDDFLSPDTIKVALDGAGFALYMSREPIPTRDKFAFGDLPAFKQVCIIPFSRACLLDYAGLDPTPLEIAESIDMLRLMEHGRRVRMVETEYDTHAVDRPHDLARVEAMLADDPLTPTYMD